MRPDAEGPGLSPRAPLGLLAVGRRAGERATTPEMAAGLATRPWTLADVAELMESHEESGKDIGRRVYGSEAK